MSVTELALIVQGPQAGVLDELDELLLLLLVELLEDDVELDELDVELELLDVDDEELLLDVELELTDDELVDGQLQQNIPSPKQNAARKLKSKSFTGNPSI